MTRYIAVHMHDYQPPRESPHTGRIERQPRLRRFPTGTRASTASATPPTGVLASSTAATTLLASSTTMSGRPSTSDRRF